MKIRPVGAELLHADGRNDMTKLIVAFRSFANAPNKIEISHLNIIKDLNLNCIYAARTAQ